MNTQDHAALVDQSEPIDMLIRDLQVSLGAVLDQFDQIWGSKKRQVIPPDQAGTWAWSPDEIPWGLSPNDAAVNVLYMMECAFRRIKDGLDQLAREVNRPLGGGESHQRLEATQDE